jgi:polyisoprenoid-binding protein YceI
MVKVATVWLIAAAAVIAQPRGIDTGKSVMKVRVYKGGLLSGLGHEHEISAPVANGSVDTTAHEVVLRVNARSLRVADPGISEKDRAEIQSNMTGVQVLDAEHFPEIVFRGTGADTGGNGAWAVKGTLTLHGQTHPVTMNVREAAGHFTGVARLRQSDFGITPIKVAGGAVRVKDEIQIEFDIQLAR